MENINYKDAIKINEDDLESEWLTQPSYYLYFSEAHAEALYEKDLAKARMEYVFATLYSDIRKNWKKYFDQKPTEPAIKAHISCSKEYRSKERKFIDATKNANILLGAKIGFEHRKNALSNLVSLKIGGFYSEPRNKRKDLVTLKEKGGRELRNSQKKALNKERKTKN